MSTSAASGTIDSQPFVEFGREVCGDLEAGLRREWLVTNGLGSYASGTLSGVNTRSYHGLLVAALNPPVDRTVLVGGMVEWAIYDGRRYALSANEYGDGTVDPQGYRNLQSFRLEGALPIWTFALADALLERRIWMEYGVNTTYVLYRLLRGTRDVQLELTPLVTYRNFHALSSGQGWAPNTEAGTQAAVVRAFDGATPFTLLASDGTFAPNGAWWWNLKYRAETARGLNDRGDLFAPGTFSTVLHRGDRYALTLTTETGERGNGDIDLAFARAQERQKQLLRTAGADAAHPAVQQLTLAADQFLVTRRVPATHDAPASEGKSVIAGYHWFNDWGRDTMIALRGLTLATGRREDAATILRSFAQYVSDGLLPNNFPDNAGVIPGYNTADATLWYVIALHAYIRETGDEALVRDLLPVVRDIVQWHTRGTRYHIGVDAHDGLLYAGEPGVQLTWMDAKVGDYVVTPRIGKPVEINALWYNVLRILAELENTLGESRAAADYLSEAERVLTSFKSRFRQPDMPTLADVVDGPDGDDWTVRPNQVFAISLPFPLIEGAEAATVIEAVGRALLTSYGLRSLTPDDPAYRGTYGGNQYQRDTSYHQGPVWTWLIGPYVEAHYHTYHDAVAARELLLPMADHLRDAGLGTISEILEGDPPHLPRGCIAQAWSVAEVLRMWRQLDQDIAAGVASRSEVGAPASAPAIP